MKILVIGSNGFIGWNALEYYRKKFPGTIGCDIYPPPWPDENFLLLDKDNPQFDQVFLRHTFDICINAHGSSSVPFSIEFPEDDYKLNAKNVFDILHAISRFNTGCRLVNFSSAAVYGNADDLPITERTRTRPVSPYGFHKLISEQICAEYYHLKNIRCCSIRIFSAYGPGLRKQLFWDVYQKAMHNGVVELYGTGEESHDFIYITDLLQALDCVLEKSSWQADIINVASGTSTTIREAVSVFLETFGMSNEIIFNKIEKPGDPARWQADISKLKTYGFSPTVSLAKGLAYYKNWILSPAAQH